jgi:N-acetyltransferase
MTFTRPVEPVTLESAVVRLEPLTLGHAPALAQNCCHPDLWKWSVVQVTDLAGMESFVRSALDEQARGVSLPFATIDPTTNTAVGSTRYLNIVPAHRRLEIGWTFIATTHQRTAINTHAKVLMLTHAFEHLGVVRVELKTDALNEKSRNAMLRIGCTFEGVFRKHMVTSTGRWRDTAWFSITDTEWPGVKARLQQKADRR